MLSLLDYIAEPLVASLQPYVLCFKTLNQKAEKAARTTVESDHLASNLHPFFNFIYRNIDHIIILVCYHCRIILMETSRKEMAYTW